MTIRGSCLCGDVQYEVRGPIGEMGHCHCSMCRKAHGAAFGTYGRVAWSDFAVLAGADRIEEYESSPGIRRTFCRRCGSTLQFIRSGRKAFGLAMGTLDADPGVRPEYQIWLGSKAPWYDAADELRSHPAEPGLG